MTDTAEIIARSIDRSCWNYGDLPSVSTEEFFAKQRRKALVKAGEIIAALTEAGMTIVPVEKMPEQPCEIKWCKTGLPVVIHVNESMDDGCWRVGICQVCADDIGISENDEMPDGRKVKAMIGAGK